ncbi:hypothetical protein BDW59DRAFT_143044 [Aspergillus cavernicola]|uniref:Uncharacterized protein n=1 Tax=Aspergillus cavernicola TaxID=176166 RepID=A0ABR4INB5_9EURO
MLRGVKKDVRPVDRSTRSPRPSSLCLSPSMSDKEKMEAYMSKTSSASALPPPSPLPPFSASRQISGPLVAFHALYENMLHFVLPLCSRLPGPHTEVPITASTHIIDMTGLTLKQFLDIKRYFRRAVVRSRAPVGYQIG